MPRRPILLFVAWTDRTGRAEELAEALGGEALGVFPRRLARRGLAPVRYLVSAAVTAFVIARRRPRRLVVTHPPVFAAATVSLCAWALRIPLVLDSHPTAFGAKDHRMSRVFLPLHRFMAKRAAAVMVASQPWAEAVDRWGGKGIVVHEAPSIEPALPPEERARGRVLFAGIFARDEPVDEVVDAARRLPEVDIRITGALDRRPHGLAERSPENISYTGYLPRSRYNTEMHDADVVLALTTEPTSVMRAAYEAVYAQAPLVISESPVLREAFPDAVFVENNAESITSGVRSALERRNELQDRALLARTRQVERWEGQLRQLRQALNMVKA